MLRAVRGDLDAAGVRPGRQQDEVPRGRRRDGGLEGREVRGDAQDAACRRGRFGEGGRRDRAERDDEQSEGRQEPSHGAGVSPVPPPARAGPA